MSFIRSFKWKGLESVRFPFKLSSPSKRTEVRPTCGSYRKSAEPIAPIDRKLKNLKMRYLGGKDQFLFEKSLAALMIIGAEPDSGVFKRRCL